MEEDEEEAEVGLFRIIVAVSTGFVDVKLFCNDTIIYAIHLIQIMSKMFFSHHLL